MMRYLIMKWTIFLFLCLTTFATVSAQPAQPLLEKRITIKADNQELSVVLTRIAQLSGCTFSYSTSAADFTRKVSLSVNNTSLREVLYKLFEGTLTFREKQQYIILKKAKSKPGKNPEEEYAVFKGYVRNQKGEAVPWVSIYDKVSLESTVSNDYGFYSIRFHPKQLPVKLYFSKQHFIDTVIAVNGQHPDFFNITLRNIERTAAPSVSINADSLAHSAEETTRSFFKSYERNPNQQNINDTLYREFQASIIPFVGTNGELSGNVINKYSLNLFGGYSLGTEALELAGFFNLNRGDVNGFQAAGFLNMTGGKVKGFQAAGFTNLVRGKVEGMQAAGFVNATWGNLKGAQFAGYVNVVKGKAEGAQFAGFVNATLDSMKGFQAAGFCNFVGASMTGTQLSGGVNITRGEVKGSQLGFMNFARVVTGTQVGFMNFADSVNGIPVGFLSFVNKGYHKIEIGTDELLPLHFALRTGVGTFHNILSAGINPGSGDTLLWNFGYGFGTSRQITKKTAIDFDITSSQMVKGKNFDKINLVNRAALGADFKVARNLSLALALTFNAHVTNSNYEDYPNLFTWTQPDVFNTTTYPAAHLDIGFWWGFKAGIRFF